MMEAARSAIRGAGSGTLRMRLEDLIVDLSCKPLL